MKLVLKTDGLTGDSLAFATKLQAMLNELPEAMGKEDTEKAIKDALGAIFGTEKGEVNVAFLETIKDMNDPEKKGSIKNALIEQGNAINSILEQVGKSMPGVSTMEQFKKDFDAKVKEGAFDKVKQDKAGAVSFVIKVAAVTTRTGAVSNNASALSDQLVGNDGAQIFEIKRGTPFILDFVTVGNTDAPAIIWFDETQKQGDFAVTAEGVVKPLIEYIWVRQSADYRKAAGRSIITEEFDKDYPRLVSKIMQLMNIDCRNEMNALILTDMIAQASPFTFAGLNGSITDPDNYAAIGAVICQLQSFFYQPNVLVLNPADAWAMRLTKDLQGRYQMSPLNGPDGKTYEFGAIITDPRVAIGFAFVGDGSIYNVDLRGDLIVRMGYSTGDFEANQYTLLVEQYFFNYISQARKPGFVYFEFATVKAVIAAA
jgi:hypothetical protein